MNDRWTIRNKGKQKVFIFVSCRDGYLHTFIVRR